MKTTTKNNLNSLNFKKTGVTGMTKAVKLFRNGFGSFLLKEGRVYNHVVVQMSKKVGAFDYFLNDDDSKDNLTKAECMQLMAKVCMR